VERIPAISHMAVYCSARPAGCEDSNTQVTPCAWSNTGTEKAIEGQQHGVLSSVRCGEDAGQ
jgi:hypothetical protein